MKNVAGLVFGLGLGLGCGLVAWASGVAYGGSVILIAKDNGDDMAELQESKDNLEDSMVSWSEGHVK